MSRFKVPLEQISRAAPQIAHGGIRTYRASSGGCDDRPPGANRTCRPRRLQSRRSAKGLLCVQPSNSQVRGQTPHPRSEKSTRRSRACEYRAPWITRNSIRLQTRFSPHRIPAAAKSPALKRAVPGRGDNGNRAYGSPPLAEVMSVGMDCPRRRTSGKPSSNKNRKRVRLFKSCTLSHLGRERRARSFNFSGKRAYFPLSPVISHPHIAVTSRAAPPPATGDLVHLTPRITRKR